MITIADTDLDPMPAMPHHDVGADLVSAPSRYAARIEHQPMNTARGNVLHAVFIARIEHPGDARDATQRGRARDPPLRH